MGHTNEMSTLEASFARYTGIFATKDDRRDA